MPRNQVVAEISALVALFCFLIPSGRADPGAIPIATPAAPTMTDMVREDILRMNEFFDTYLPGTLAKRNLVLDFSPKFSDFRDREYIRYPIDVRYGLTPQLELFGGMTPFHPNPINAGYDHRSGLGEGRFGFRYNVGRLWRFYDAATVGVLLRSPFGMPPIDIIDRYSHVRPFISATRRLPFPFTTFYTNYAYDREVNTPGRKAPPGIFRKQHLVEVIPGVLYKPGEFGYFAEYTFHHYAIEDGGGAYLGHEVKVGAIWDVPLARTQKWRLPGKWQLEVAYKFDHDEGYAIHNGITTRVSWRTTLKELLNRTKKSPTTP